MHVVFHLSGLVERWKSEKVESRLSLSLSQCLQVKPLHGLAAIIEARHKGRFPGEPEQVGILEIGFHRKPHGFLAAGDQQGVVPLHHPDLVGSHQGFGDRASFGVIKAGLVVEGGIVSQSALKAAGRLQVQPGKVELVVHPAAGDGFGLVVAVGGGKLGIFLQDDRKRAAPLSERRGDGGEVVDAAAVAELVQEEVDGQTVFRNGPQAGFKAGRIQQIDDDRKVPDLVFRHNEVKGGRRGAQRRKRKGIAGGEAHDVRIAPQIERGAGRRQNPRHHLVILGQKRLVFVEGHLVSVAGEKPLRRLVVRATQRVEELAHVAQMHDAPVFHLAERREAHENNVGGGHRPKLVGLAAARGQRKDGGKLAQVLPRPEVGKRIEAQGMLKAGRLDDLDVVSALA